MYVNKIGTYIESIRTNVKKARVSWTTDHKLKS